MSKRKSYLHATDSELVPSILNIGLSLSFWNTGQGTVGITKKTKARIYLVPDSKENFKYIVPEFGDVAFRVYLPKGTKVSRVGYEGSTRERAVFVDIPPSNLKLLGSRYKNA